MVGGWLKRERNERQDPVRAVKRGRKKKEGDRGGAVENRETVPSDLAALSFT